MTDARQALRALLVLAVVLVALAVGWVLLVAVPGTLVDLFGVLAVLAVGVAALRAGSSLADAVLPAYNVAEVAVEGPITRDGGGSPLSPPVGTGAEAVVEQIERADEDRGADALLLRLNTPGGEIVPSEDIRLAVERFDGPTVGYATDVCASGGYDVATACDEFWARESSLVGSIGVIGSRVNAAALADTLGLSYERIAAGEYKDAGVPLKELKSDERAYLQGLVDDYYDRFVETVAEGRDLEESTVRETEARVFLGAEAADRGLVDETGTREDVEDALADRLEAEPTVRTFEPDRGIAERLRAGGQALAYAFGAGVAGVLGGDVDGLTLRR